MLAASMPVAHPRGPADDMLCVPHLDARHFHGDPAAASAALAKYIAHRQPVIFDGCVAHWPALDCWTHAYLRETLGGSVVHVAKTPNGLGARSLLEPLSLSASMHP